MTTKVKPTVEKWELEWQVYDKKLKRVVDDAELIRIVKRAYRAKKTMVLPFDIDSLAITQDGRIFVIDDTGETMWLDPKRYSIKAHSVQEAKAEERERIKQAISKLYRKEKYAKAHYTPEGRCDICHSDKQHFEDCDYAIYTQVNQTLDSVLSTLNTKASLKQEEDR